MTDVRALSEAGLIHLVDRLRRGTILPAESDQLDAGIRAMAANLKAAETERDLAIAHDRQPYPTTWAHEQACTALATHRRRADTAETAMARVRGLTALWATRTDQLKRAAELLGEALADGAEPEETEARATLATPLICSDERHQALVSVLRTELAWQEAVTSDYRVESTALRRKLAAFHEGEEEHLDEHSIATPAQLIWRWNRTTPAKRLEVAKQIQWAQATASRCFMEGHAERPTRPAGEQHRYDRATPQEGRFPYRDVQGRCPACGKTSLFLGDGGYITCSRLECPEPDAASTALERQPVRAAAPAAAAAPDLEPDDIVLTTERGRALTVVQAPHRSSMALNMITEHKAYLRMPTPDLIEIANQVVYRVTGYDAAACTLLLELAEDWRPNPTQAEPVDLPAFMNVTEYRHDRGHQAWAWRCWGQGDCKGWLATDMGSEEHARQGAARHLAESHVSAKTLRLPEPLSAERYEGIKARWLQAHGNPQAANHEPYNAKEQQS
ncbi:hypothetical protein [Streptomyces sp. H27-C3]|uniref:hypothetical protein n=1 Tax=Streptomyces sp. H27-C3 TaxID=3046305 RepID=UPI0024B8FF83|nr:hypothetical protein [Streptomyces sp. H27-C3]MDJ0460621.1 hypothetical protein [Streptomyces sp. H27-C3]